jgi:dolichol-phosphate mannosyltransferase
MDAGGSHDVVDAPGLLHALDAGADVVLGSRFIRGSAYAGGPWWRPWASRAMGVACWGLTGARFSDWSSGYRAFSADAATRLSRCSTMATMHGWQLEVLAWAVSLGLVATEVPITYRAGRSSMSPKVAREALLSLSHIMHHIPPAGSTAARVGEGDGADVSA